MTASLTTRVAASGHARPSPEQRAAALRKRLPELIELEELCELARGVAEVTVEAEILHEGLTLPVHSFAFGAKDPTLPTLAIVGGVHGLERIGTQITIGYLRTVLELVQWDKGLQHLLERCRLLFYPLVNPGGTFARSRSNPLGVDLMRNAPLDAEVKPNVKLVCGHRLSPRLPWYRGPAGAPMEPEARALSSFVERELFASRFSVAIDLHSGFGLMDRLWFPYAYSFRPYERIDLMYALRQRLMRSLPNHPYHMEPQSLQYVTHGDLWDKLVLDRAARGTDGVFLPVTLEMGSWLWVKKNPRQMFSPLGIFNPLLPHRIQRTLRRHLTLLDFLLRAVVSHDNWATPAHLLKGESGARGMELWYPAYKPVTAGKFLP